MIHIAKVCVLPVDPGTLELSPVGAATVARALTADTLAIAGAPAWARPVRAPLGASLESVAQRAIADGAAVILVGAHSPGLPVSRLEAAHAALERADAVVGPADGGGLYLLGLRRCPRGLLAGLAWDTPHLRSILHDRLRGAKLASVVLDRWHAIDNLGALVRLRALLRAGIVDAPVTARLLAPRICAIARADGDGDLSRCLVALDRVHGVDHVAVADGPEAANRIAIAVDADVVWLVRADASVPPDAERHIVDALLDPAVVGGAFGTTAAPGEWWRAAVPRLADLRARLTGLPHAGQAPFARRDAFLRVGGLPREMLGDLELARRLRRMGRVVRVAARVELQRVAVLTPRLAAARAT